MQRWPDPRASLLSSPPRTGKRGSPVENDACGNTSAAGKFRASSGVGLAGACIGERRRPTPTRLLGGELWEAGIWPAQPAAPHPSGCNLIRGPASSRQAGSPSTASGYDHHDDAEVDDLQHRAEEMRVAGPAAAHFGPAAAHFGTGHAHSAWSREMSAATAPASPALRTHSLRGAPRGVTFGRGDGQHWDDSDADANDAARLPNAEGVAGSAKLSAGRWAAAATQDAPPAPPRLPPSVWRDGFCEPRLHPTAQGRPIPLSAHGDEWNEPQPKAVPQRGEQCGGSGSGAPPCRCGCSCDSPPLCGSGGETASAVAASTRRRSGSANTNAFLLPDTLLDGEQWARSRREHQGRQTHGPSPSAAAGAVAACAAKAAQAAAGASSVAGAQTARRAEEASRAAALCHRLSDGPWRPIGAAASAVDAEADGKGSHEVIGTPPRSGSMARGVQHLFVHEPPLFYDEDDNDALFDWGWWCGEEHAPVARGSWPFVAGLEERLAEAHERAMREMHRRHAHAVQSLDGHLAAWESIIVPAVEVDPDVSVAAHDDCASAAAAVVSATPTTAAAAAAAASRRAVQRRASRLAPQPPCSRLVPPPVWQHDRVDLASASRSSEVSYRGEASTRDDASEARSGTVASSASSRAALSPRMPRGAPGGRSRSPLGMPGSAANGARESLSERLLRGREQAATPGFPQSRLSLLAAAYEKSLQHLAGHIGAT